MNFYYNKEGKPVSREEAMEFFDDMNYRRVDETTLYNGTYISTVFLVINHGFTENPIIFETMVFENKTENSLGDECDCKRYHTLEEAKNGHKKMVEKWIKKHDV